jgi:hypothetical protein
MWVVSMNEKMLRKVMITNMALWAVAIVMPIFVRAFSSKDPKIFDILTPMLQLMLASASTRMFSVLQKSNTE